MRENNITIDNLEEKTQEWIKNIPTQNNDEYKKDSKEYCDMLCNLDPLYSISEEENDIILEKCEHIIEEFFDTADTEHTIRGLDFVKQCYSCLSYKYDNYNDELVGCSLRSKKKNEFDFFGKIEWVLEGKIFKDNAINEYDWESFIEYLIRFTQIAYKYVKNAHKNKVVKQITHFCYLLGENMTEGTRLRFVGNFIDYFKSYSYYDSLPVDAKIETNESFSHGVIAVLLSSARDCDFTPTKVWLDNIEKILWNYDNETMVYDTLKLYIYIYYLAFNTEEYSSNTVITDAKGFLYESDTRECINALIQDIAKLDNNFGNNVAGRYDILNANFEHDLIKCFIQEDLGPCLSEDEEKPFASNVYEFLLCLLCYIEIELKENVMDDHLKDPQIKRYKREVRCDNREEVSKLLKRLWKLVDISDDESNLFITSALNKLEDLKLIED